MKLLSFNFQQFSTKIFLRSFIQRFCTMSSEDDSVHDSHEKITLMIMEGKEKNSAVKEYLKNVKYPLIMDFKSGLEWFNVSEPLSFAKHLKGKIVVLDFFTYCCINCMHILPDLRELENEFSIEEGLVVIGVHSAKFENEKISSNILAAVQRYNISHPVVNDHEFGMWKNCDVNCWPTLLLLGPNANPLVMLTGEGHKEDLRLYIRNALEYYKELNQISNHKLPLKSSYHLLPDQKGPLLFPGKITNFVENNHEILAVSDTGNNRILILDYDGTVLCHIGNRKVGFRDGNLKNCEFNSPQGIYFQNKETLFVADTENHAIRKVDLKKQTVETIVGTGIQGHDHKGGKLWTAQKISSPWDICIYRTKDFGVSDSPLRDVLLIAMAGTHQIWALFLDDTIWWKGRKYPAGTCCSIAGSGREENRNNQYPHAAGFAQPSGLALCMKNKEVYIADSESSSVRRLSLVDGRVTPVVGGNRNPNNLFAFGDKDGCLFDARLQHTLGLALSKDENTLFIADTYNHKLKKVDIHQNSVVSLSLNETDSTDGTSLTFNEPAGLCVSADGTILHLADTNNHFIKIIKLDGEKISSVKTLDLKLSRNQVDIDKSKYQILQTESLKINQQGGKLICTIKAVFKNGLSATPDVPQQWFVDLSNGSWSAVPSSGSDLKNIDIVVNISNKNITNDKFVDIIFDLVTCTTETCLLKNVIVRIPVEFANNGGTNISKVVQLVLEPSSLKLE